jgi:hypothetical protein
VELRGALGLYLGLNCLLFDFFDKIMDDHIENANGYLDYESPEFNFEQKVDDSWTFSPDYFSRLGCSDDVDVCDVEFENNFTKSLDFMKNDFESAYNASACIT